MHLVLDLDGTLVNNKSSRPYLTEFLDYCFDHFESVSIWTAASESWLQMCYETYMSKYTFRCMWSIDDCWVQPSSQCEVEPIVVIKPLSKLWNEFPDMNEKNTLIIDDNLGPSQNNPLNYLPIKEYIGDKDDIEFGHIMLKLEHIFNDMKGIDDIQQVDFSEL